MGIFTVGGLIVLTSGVTLGTSSGEYKTIAECWRTGIVTEAKAAAQGLAESGFTKDDVYFTAFLCYEKKSTDKGV